MAFEVQNSILPDYVNTPRKHHFSPYADNGG